MVNGTGLKRQRMDPGDKTEAMLRRIEEFEDAEEEEDGDGEGGAEEGTCFALPFRTMLTWTSQWTMNSQTRILETTTMPSNTSTMEMQRRTMVVVEEETTISHFWVCEEYFATISQALEDHDTKRICIYGVLARRPGRAIKTLKQWTECFWPHNASSLD